jgi:tetratricopeptide (TPR) repeat protein
MDRFSAHMDRGWDLIGRGELTPAMIAARQALEMNRDNPEVHNLIGYIHAMEGEFDDALECYRRAIDLDEWYLDPILNAAELLVHPDADPDEAIRLCRRATEMDLEPWELADVLLIEVDALLNMGRDDEARELLGGIEEPESLPAPHQVLMGRALFDLGDLEGAKGFVQRSLDQDPSNPDGWYCAGLVAREEGRRVDAVIAFLSTMDRDLDLPRVPWAMADAELDALVRSVVDSLDPALRELLAGTRIVVEPYPSEQSIKDEGDPRQVVLARGVDRDRGAFESLHVYQLNFERVAAPMFAKEELGRLIAAELGA